MVSTRHIRLRRRDVAPGICPGVSWELGAAPEKYGGDVTVKKIYRHVPGDDGLVCLKQIEIARAYLCRDFETDVQQLAKAAIVGRIALRVAQGGRVPVRGPFVDVGRRGKLGWIDVDANQPSAQLELQCIVEVGLAELPIWADAKASLGALLEALPARARMQAGRMPMDCGVEVEAIAYVPSCDTRK